MGIPENTVKGLGFRLKMFGTSLPCGIYEGEQSSRSVLLELLFE